MFRNIRLLLIYIRILNKNKESLKIEHGLSVDWVYRMYKTYTIPTDEVDNIKNFGFKYFDTMIKKEIAIIDKTFIKIGLSELCGLMEVKELNDRQVGIAFRFKYLNTSKMFSRLVWLLLYTIGGLIGFAINTFLGGLIGLLIVLLIYVFTRIIV